VHLDLIKDGKNSTISYNQAIKPYHTLVASLVDNNCHGDRVLNVLDVGCGTGNTLLELVRLGVSGNLHIADVDKRCIDITKEKVSVVGEYLIDSVCEMVTEKDGCYDFVLYSHVLQYEHRPRDVIKHLCEKLHEEGHLIIAISNVMTLPKLFNAVRKKHYSEGIVTWDKATLQNLIASISTCKIMSWSGDYVPIPFFGSTKIGVKLGSMLRNIFPNLCFSLVVVVKPDRSTLNDG